MSCRAPLLLLIAALAGVAHAQAPVGQLFASDASVKGSVVMASGGAQVLPGSSVTAGEVPASLHLTRGGEVRICPRAGLSVNTGQKGLMFGMSTGALEAHYSVPRSVDTVLTPDFRIELVGPGEFHLAIGADSRGNTCVRALPANTASVIVTELMGNDVYQVPRDGYVLFRNGSMQQPETLVPPDCGCPALPPVQRAEVSPLPPPGVPHIGRPIPPPPDAMPPAEPPAPTDAALTAPLPPIAPGEAHVQIDAPMVFNAAEPVVPPPPVMAHLRIARVPSRTLALPETAQPPAPPPLVVKAEPAPLPRPRPRRGVFGHIRSFFAAIFR